MMRAIYPPTRSLALLLVLAALLSGPALAQWSTGLGGNPSRNGRARGVGPTADTVAWTLGVQSQIGLAPLVAEGRVVTMHTNDWMSESGSWIVAHDLATGRRQWATQLPPSISGFAWWSRPLAARDGRVYAARGNNGLLDEYLFALDASDGSILWMSQDKISLGLGGTPTFLPNGDLVINGEFLGPFKGYNHLRIDAATGETVWEHARHMDPEDGGGVALGSRLYFRELLGGLEVVRRIDPATGLILYSGPGIPVGSSAIGPPAVAPDGTVLVTARQADFSTALLALDDTGTSLDLRWRRPVGPTIWSNLGVGPDGSIYVLGEHAELLRLDPATGGVVDRTQPLVTPDPFTTCRIAVDDAGQVFAMLTPTWDGELYAFDEELGQLWHRAEISSPFGGPTLAPDGTLLLSTYSQGITAWR